MKHGRGIFVEGRKEVPGGGEKEVWAGKDEVWFLGGRWSLSFECMEWDTSPTCQFAVLSLYQTLLTFKSQDYSNPQRKSLQVLESSRH